jgi:CBS domain containing-hemolysin-like protein
MACFSTSGKRQRIAVLTATGRLPAFYAFRAQRRCLEKAFRMLQEKQAPAMAVTDPNGRLVGLVTSETVGEMLILHRCCQRAQSSGRGRG